MSVEVSIDFEEECSHCYSNGYVLGRANERKPCPRCNGSGRAPTELGRDLLEFLNHQGFQPNIGSQPEKGVK